MSFESRSVLFSSDMTSTCFMLDGTVDDSSID